MAFSCATRNLFSILPLLVVLSITFTPLAKSFAPSDKVTKQLVDQICSDSAVYHKNFCVDWLTFDPETFKTDLSGLVELVIVRTHLFAYKNLGMMKDLARTTADPTLKAPYGNCVTGYETAIQAIVEAEGFATSKSYLLASYRALKAVFSISTCAGQLDGRTNVPAYVPQRNLLFVRMCTVANVFSSALAN
ncbi:unnamed protein product [Microthlaspi erraticum]|uniref:Pectinesterase inhibitor domain-containing protein n=1 Tax=Microthlaspi erraticum TaxID=1685480 RepID=A0A6D2HJS6_9BRAS|nr:unnamed protein product [Microthlaspi erraticum]